MRQDSSVQKLQKLRNSKSQNLRNLETQRLSDSVSWRLGVLKKSHVVTTVSRQAVECEARNPCIRDRNVIKVLKARQRYFLSHLRRFDFLCNLILQGFRTACFITCLGTAAPSELF